MQPRIVVASVIRNRELFFKTYRGKYAREGGRLPEAGAQAPPLDLLPREAQRMNIWCISRTRDYGTLKKYENSLFLPADIADCRYDPDGSLFRALRDFLKRSRVGVSNFYDVDADAGGEIERICGAYLPVFSPIPMPKSCSIEKKLKQVGVNFSPVERCVDPPPSSAPIRKLSCKRDKAKPKSGRVPLPSNPSVEVSERAPAGRTLRKIAPAGANIRKAATNPEGEPAVRTFNPFDPQGQVIFARPGQIPATEAGASTTDPLLLSFWETVPEREARPASAAAKSAELTLLEQRYERFCVEIFSDNPHLLLSGGEPVRFTSDDAAS